MSSARSQMNAMCDAYAAVVREGAFPQVRWWGDQVTDYGQRLEQHQARIDRQIDDLDAMLADYRRIGA